MPSWVRLRAATDRSGATPAFIEPLPSEAEAEDAARPSLFGSNPAMRVWAFTGALALAAGLIYRLLLAQESSSSDPLVPWPLLAAVFAAAELKVVEVHFRRETHSFSLSEFPAVVGFFFLSPSDYLLAVLAGSAAALVFGARQRALKTAFNLANYMFIGVAELSIISAFGPIDVFGRLEAAPGPEEWIAVFAATSAATVLSSFTIAIAITLSGGAPQYEKLPEMIRFGGMVSLANTSLALLAVVIIRNDPVLLWLLCLPLVIVFVAYRAFLSEREKHEQLELLYQSSRILQHSPELDSALVALLNHAREMFRAELAEVVLYPRGEEVALRTSSWNDREGEVMAPVSDLESDPIYGLVQAATGPLFVEKTGDRRIRQALVSPLRGESELVGSLMIANRLTEGTSFRDEDLPLFETLANQVAAALENGHLEQSLSELSRLKEQLRFQAYHDALTGLPNRSLLMDRIAERLATRAPGRMPVVLFLDLDEFKVVNDTLGHAAGDRLLIEVAERIRRVLRSDDVAARLGGDEFAILLEDGPELATAVAIGDRIIDSLRVAFLIDGTEVQVGASIGVAAARTGTERADELLRNGDVAMYTAKASGKNRVAVFEPLMHAAIVARHELSAELSRSLGRGELLLLYQPIMDIQRGVSTGVEALVRWRHPTRGLVGPDEFIPLAEDTGIIVPLGRWVLEEACRQTALWATSEDVRRQVTVTVNLAAQQLQEASFVADLRQILDESGLDARQLVLEMTETVMFHDITMTIEKLAAIRALGVRIAIDDFGTGYSSLGYLRRFPVDILKIAREFIGQSDHPDDWPFAAAIVALGRALDLRIVAEGIEEPGQLAHLRELGCEFGQGYLFSVPIDGDAAGRFLRTTAPGGADDAVAKATATDARSLPLPAF